ncbi:MAG: thiolase family protein, partial [Streptosporangiales bacterium]|nr:thiolase family protein [Streptosporangiales bacterium]
MPDPVIVSAVRTAVGTAFKGTLANTTAEELGTVIVKEAAHRSGLDPQLFDDVILADPGTIARYAAVANGMLSVPGQSIGRYCAGSLAAVGNAAATIKADMDRAIIAGGVFSASTTPRSRRRKLFTKDEWEDCSAQLNPVSDEAPTFDMSILVGHNTAVEAGITRDEMDRWALRSHQRAIAAIDDGRFAGEIVPVKATTWDGSVTEFAVDEHPRRSTTLEKLASLKVLHPEIEGFGITAGNSSGVNDAASAAAVVSEDLAAGEGLTPVATVRAWAAAGVHPARTGFGALDVIGKLLTRSGRQASDIALWEINEAFASVPIAACRAFGLDEEKVNFSGSGCSIGHPISASGTRMIATLVHELRRRGGGLGVAAMCAAAGQG